MSIKNVALTTTFVCWDTVNNNYKTGETWNGSSGTLSLFTTGDGTTAAMTAAVTEVDSVNSPGLYKTTIPLGTMIYNDLTLSGKSSNTGIVVISRRIDCAANTIQINGADQTAGDVVANQELIKAKTGNLPAQPAAVGSDMGSVTSVGAGGITDSSLSTSAVTKIQDGLATPTNITGGTITTVSDKTGFSLTADYDSAKTSAQEASVQSIYDIVKAAGSGDNAAMLVILNKFGFTGDNVNAESKVIPDVTLAATQANYAPAKAGDAMALTPAYDAAKTAATQTSVNAIPTSANSVDFNAVQKASLSSISVTIGDVTLATLQPNYAPAKAGDAMTLTSDYDSAKTAATQASVDLIPNESNNIDFNETQIANFLTPVIADVTLAAVQPNYAPAKAGDAMLLTSAYDSAKTAAQSSEVAAIDAKIGDPVVTIADDIKEIGTQRLVTLS